MPAVFPIFDSHFLFSPYFVPGSHFGQNVGTCVGVERRKYRQCTLVLVVSVRTLSYQVPRSSVRLSLLIVIR